MANKRTDAVEAADGEARGITVLEDQIHGVVLLVSAARRTAHLLVGDGAGETEETIARVSEGVWIAGVRMHPRRRAEQYVDSANSLQSLQYKCENTA